MAQAAPGASAATVATVAGAGLVVKGEMATLTLVVLVAKGAPETWEVAGVMADEVVVVAKAQTVNLAVQALPVQV